MAQMNLMGVRPNSEFYGLTLFTTIPTDTNFSCSCPPGAYSIQVFARGTIAGVTTTVSVFPFQDAEQTVVGSALWCQGSQNVAGTVNSLTQAYRCVLTAGADARYIIYPSSTNATVPTFNILIPFGFQVAWVLGTTVQAAGTLQVFATRWM